MKLLVKLNSGSRVKYHVASTVRSVLEYLFTLPEQTTFETSWHVVVSRCHDVLLIVRIFPQLYICKKCPCVCWLRCRFWRRWAPVRQGSLMVNTWWDHL